MDSAAAARPDEEEARRRRSTDCIYFLASPLTCNKGSECDFRHSDAARMNPRDCWYWFNGNCTNPKCSFRHPPLDNLLGAPTTPRAPQQPAPQVSAPAQGLGSVPAKQAVPCYYFQKGMCAKGDRCAFSHGPQSAPQLKVFTTPALHPNPQLNNSWTKPSPSPQQNTPAGIPDKSNLSAHDAKPPQKQHAASRVDHSSRIFQNHNSSYAQSGSTKHHKPQPPVQEDSTEDAMEVGEFVREPSAASGVLVAGVGDHSKQSFKGNHSSYHHRTNGTGITRQTHGSYEPGRSHRASDERLSSDKRISHREPMPAVAASSSDLRHRLLKQRKLNNNSRSTEAPDTNDAYLEGEHSDQHRWRREDHDGPLSRSRLRDRIRLPGETSFDRLGSRSEDWDRGPIGRLSPPKHSDLRGKLHERLKARSAEEIPGNSAKGLVVKASTVDEAESLNFAGPKSLAELKAKKGVGSSSGEDAIVKGIGSSRMTSGIIPSREPAPFEGPKPLSAILKRKREVASESDAAHSGGIQDDDDAAGVDEACQILATDKVEENMEGNIEEEEGEEGAFHPEDDVEYDDNANESADQELEEQQDVEAAAEDYDYEVADADNAAGEELEERQDVEAAAEDYDYEAADANNAAGEELEERQDVEAAAEDYDYEVADANNAAGEELEDHQDVEAAAGDYDYEAADTNNAAGEELEERQDAEAAAEDYDYEAADVNAEDNEYQGYQDDDDLEDDDDDDDFARKVGVMIS